MQTTISGYHESATCTWCQKQSEAVTVEFADGFLSKGPYCWKCLQQATRVHHMQDTGGRAAGSAKAATNP